MIGTHRLLSKDVSFKDLGLVVVDELTGAGIERATILADSEFIEPRHLPNVLLAAGEAPQPALAIAPGTTVEEAERKLIQMTLEHTRDNKTRAAEILGISLKTLHNKLNRLKLRK